MSTFIVISVKENLNWIVDGIKSCRPHNPDVVSYLSTGKIKKTEADEYLYEYTTYGKHAGDVNADETIAKKVERDTPRNLFTNQIAQILNVSDNEGEQINVFLLDNPMTDADFQQSSWITDEIKEVYNNHFATNFQLVRVLFSDEIENPSTVTRQAPGMILNNLIKLCTEYSDGFQTKVLYLDNQNRNGAAICLDREMHDMMLPRMLCDLMMLMSNKDDSYNTGAAVNSRTGVFSVGYSECMYYHDDVFRYFKLANKRDLLKFVLEDQNEETSLDFDNHPLGLKDRIQRLSRKYEEVPFSEDITHCDGSIDKEIDDILHSFAADLAEIKAKALEAADLLDHDATEAARKAKLQELGLDPPTTSIDQTDSGGISPAMSERRGCNFLYRIFGKKRDIDAVDDVVVDSRVADILITEERDRVNKEYPDFISRKEIYEQYMVEVDEGDDFNGDVLCENIGNYQKVILFIASPLFKRFLKDKYGESWLKMKKSIESIFSMLNQRELFFRLKDRAQELEYEMSSLNQELHDFKLTIHCSSVDNLIDLDKLKSYQQKDLNYRIEKWLDAWNTCVDKSWSVLEQIMEKHTKWEIFDFYYIKWDRPFEFIKDINMTSVCNRIKAKSQVFVNTYTLSCSAENLTSYYFYSDNQEWVNQINAGIVDVNMETSALFSSHICSKICMFQFLQLTQELIEGLVDCYEN